MRDPSAGVRVPPTASGAIMREAAKVLQENGTDPEPLLLQAGLSREQVESTEARIPAQRQIKFLNLVAEFLKDDLLGMHLATQFEPRAIGLFYFVLASSTTFGEALRRVERYTCILNDGVHLRRLDNEEVGLRCAYTGVARHSDRHQIEFILTFVSRVAAQMTGLRVRPARVCFAHPSCGRQNEREAEGIIGCRIEFSAAADEIAFEKSISEQSLILADPFLNELLVGYCEQALAHRSRPVADLQTRVENAIVPLLPHGTARLSEVARALGMSQRSLSRQLAVQDVSFAKILDSLRLDLARYYLGDDDLSVTEISWLLGFKDPTAFTHAFKHWTGMSPASARKRARQSHSADPKHRASMSRNAAEI